MTKFFTYQQEAPTVPAPTYAKNNVANKKHIIDEEYRQKTR